MNLAVIPARGGSKRIPNKNIKNFHGKPIVAYSIEAACNSGCFDEVMVSTDSKEIADIAKSFGAKVPFLRSEKNSDDFASTASVLIEVLDNYAKNNTFFDNLCCLYPTAPFVTAKKLKSSFDIFNKADVTSLVSICKFSFPVQRGMFLRDGKLEFCHPEFALTRSQDLPPVYHDAGQFYWCKVKDFFFFFVLINKNSVVYEFEEFEFLDIYNLTVTTLFYNGTFA